MRWIVLLPVLAAFGQDATLQKAQKMFKPIPTSPPVLKANASSPAKVELERCCFSTRDYRQAG